MESFIELRAPIVALGLGSKLSLLVSEMRPDEIHLDERTEHATLYHPLQVVRCYHWNYNSYVGYTRFFINCAKIKNTDLILLHTSMRDLPVH